MTKVSPTIRDNCHYVVVLRLPRNQIQDCVFGMQSDVGDKYHFFDVYNDGTQQKYSSMMLQQVDPYSPNIVFIQPVDLGTGNQTAGNRTAGNPHQGEEEEEEEQEEEEDHQQSLDLDDCESGAEASE